MLGRYNDSVYSCTLCSFRSADGIEFTKHIFEAHSFDSEFRYMCGISSCTRVFESGSSFDAFRSHCNRKHHNWQHNFTPSFEDSSGITVSGSSCGSDTSTRETCESTECTLYDHTESIQEARDFDENVVIAEAHDQPKSSNIVLREDVKKAAAKFILTLKEKFKLTQVSLDYTVKAVDELLVLSRKCDDQFVSENSELADSSPFEELRTEYQQTKFFNENFGLIVSGKVLEH